MVSLWYFSEKSLQFSATHLLKMTDRYGILCTTIHYNVMPFIEYQIPKFCKLSLQSSSTQ